MNYSKNLLLIAFTFMTVSLPGFAHADGMFVAPLGSFMYEPAQQAIIQYDQDTGIEQLTILPHFYGDTAEFAWIVPVPGQPEVSPADQQLFWDLDSISQAIYQSREGEWGCFLEDRVYDVYSPDNLGAVEVISTELIGYYQTTIVSATETVALMDSLSQWGFLHEDNIEAVYYALDYYISLGWYFVAMRVDAEAMEKSSTEKLYPYYGGGLDPLTFTFASDDMIYPMKISSLSASSVTRVNIYTITDHRMQFPGSQTYYANGLTADEIRELEQKPSLIGLFEPGDFVTKLHRQYSPDDMDEDIILSQAPNDNEFVMINYSGLPWTAILLFGPAAVWAVIRRRKLLG